MGWPLQITAKTTDGITANFSKPDEDIGAKARKANSTGSCRTCLFPVIMAAFSRAEYEHFLYSLTEQYPNIHRSTLRLYTNSAKTALVRGTIYFKNGLELRVFEYVDMIDGEIFDYSYAVYQDDVKIRWYDPQPHPENPALAENFPHHFHEERNIKHNRQPAPGITFTVPNLPTLIADCLALKGK